MWGIWTKPNITSHAVFFWILEIWFYESYNTTPRTQNALITGCLWSWLATAATNSASQEETRKQTTSWAVKSWLKMTGTVAYCLFLESCQAFQYQALFYFILFFYLVARLLMCTAVFLLNTQTAKSLLLICYASVLAAARAMRDMLFSNCPILISVTPWKISSDFIQ